MQTYVAGKVTKNLNETYGTDIHIKRLGLNWKGEVDVRDIYIADHHQDTLIYGKELQTNILSFQNLIKGDLGFGDILLTRAKLYIKTYKGEDVDNLTVFAKKFDTGKKSESPFSLFSNDIALVDSHVKFTNENLDKPEVLNLQNLNLVANNFKVNGPDIKANIQELSMLTNWGIKVVQMEADFSYTQTEIVLKDLLLETENSKIVGEVILDTKKGMADFINDVFINATFEESQVATSDINAFYNEFATDQVIELQGNLKGTLNDFVFTNVQMQSNETRVAGDFSFENLLTGEGDYSITASNHIFQTSYYELRRFMPRVLGNMLPEELKPLGNVDFRGDTRITPTELSTISIINTAIGRAQTELEMSNFNNISNAVYRGNVVFTQFDIGKISNTPSLGKTNANLEFDGRGFSQTTIDTEVSGNISSMVFNGYNYQNIILSGNLKNPLFNGNLSIDDPNLKLEFKGLIDASKDFNHYDFEADVEFAELHQLNLVTRDSISVFTGKVVVDMDGTTIDNVSGTISFNQTFYQNENDNFYFDDFKVISSFDGPVRTIEINSPDIITGRINGEFLIADIPNLFLNGIGNIYANFIPAEVTTNQYLDYQFVIYNKIVDVFVPELQLGENTQIRGSVSSDDSEFTLDFRSPEILILKNYLGNVNIQVDNDNPLYNTYIEVDSVYTGFYNLVDVSIINKTLNDTMYVRSEFKGGERQEDLFNLSLYHTINQNGNSVVGVKRSDITYKENVWYLNEDNNNSNKVVFDENFSRVRIDSLVLSHNDELIEMAGIIRDSTYKDIKLRFTDVNLGNITPYIDSLELQGNINGELAFLQRDGAYYPNSAITIDNVIINETAFGDLILEISGNENLTQYDINTTLTNNNVQSISAIGNINISGKNPQIFLNVDLNEFNMQAFSPFGGEVISNIRGLLSGSAQVSGNYKSPDILGRFSLENSGLKIPFLNVDFDIEDDTQIIVTKNKFDIGSTGITDTKFNTVGRLSGNATHSNFRNWELNLNIDAPERLVVLDTPPDEDALYYGTAFISGNASITGPTDELVIKVAATTEEGTTFKIPISDTEAISDASFVRFLSPDEKEARIRGETIVSKEVKGLTMDFDLDINTNAVVEVVVDKVNNTTLKGRGEGTLLIRINTLGKFQMYGGFVVYDGNFDFRYGGLIQKNLEVVGGGTINWEGSPERAQLNLSALYKTNANPSVLLDNPTANRKIPVEVYIDLKGELIQPDLTFRIEFPRTSSTLQSELEYKLQNEEQRQKQALFLIASNSFVNDDFGGTNAFSGTLADRVSSLVSDLFTDEDAKIVFALDYTVGERTPTYETGGQVGVTISTKINERILVNGKVGVPVGGVNETAVAGDIEVQWLVNEDGSLRMSFFNRQADLQFIGEDQIFEQGVGISYTVDFDTFRELFFKLFNKKLTLESEEGIPITPDDSSYPADLNGTKED